MNCIRQLTLLPLCHLSEFIIGILWNCGLQSDFCMLLDWNTLALNFVSVFTLTRSLVCSAFAKMKITGVTFFGRSKCHDHGRKIAIFCRVSISNYFT